MTENSADSFVDSIRRQREQLRAQYGSLLDEISDILFRYDPVGINFGINTDEYEPEAMTILPRLETARTDGDTQRIVQSEFERWFGPSTTIRNDRCVSAANEIWQVWCERRAH